MSARDRHVSVKQTSRAVREAVTWTLGALPVEQANVQEVPVPTTDVSTTLITRERNAVTARKQSDGDTLSKSQHGNCRGGAARQRVGWVVEVVSSVWPDMLAARPSDATELHETTTRSIPVGCSWRVIMAVAWPQSTINAVFSARRTFYMKSHQSVQSCKEGRRDSRLQEYLYFNKRETRVVDSTAIR